MSSPRITLSVIIPAFNESRRMGATLRKIGAHLAALDESVEILIVDDGSSDGTLDTVRELAAEIPVALRVERYTRNRGKGHALKVGFAAARGQRLLFTDADLSVPIEHVSGLLAQLDSGYDVAIGSRKIAGAEIAVRQPWLRESMGKIFTWLVRLLITSVSDSTCGFKAFTREAGRDLFARSRIDDWSFDAEILWLVRARGYSLTEVPVRWVHGEGTKVRVGRDAVRSLLGLAKIRWYAARGAYDSSCPSSEEVLGWNPTEATKGASALADHGHLDGTRRSAREQVARQRAFYAGGEHAHLRPGAGEFYAAKLVYQVSCHGGMGPEHRVLEVGAGFGRFTFPLLECCGSLVALDLSERVLDDLRAERDRRLIPESRCRTHCADVNDFSPSELDGEFDFVVGFFFLHHLPDFPRTIAQLCNVLRPGGRMIFVEPNRRNPLFVAQVLCCPNMHWREEKGMFLLSQRKVERAYREAGLDGVQTRRFGFFPPQVLDRFRPAQSLEARLERVGWLNGVLPFLMTLGRFEAPRGMTP